jgi:rhodanese-related sulfurtransferase
MENLDQKTWREKISKDKNAVIIDARTPQEWETGIIKDALLIDFLQASSFMEELNKLDKSKNYYIYCRSGNRSGQACQIADSIGCNETYNLMGGMLVWNEETVSPS